MVGTRRLHGWPVSIASHFDNRVHVTRLERCETSSAAAAPDRSDTVGRSDTDVQQRRLDQARDREYSYFTVEHKCSTKKAWLRRTWLYHFHKSTLDN